MVALGNDNSTLRLAGILLCYVLFVGILFGQANAVHKKGVSILFVGNSLTYYNNLPELVKQNAKTHGIRLKYDLVAKPNYAIVDHWAEGKVQKLIAKNKYDYVIVQQGPSSQNEGRQMLIESGKDYKQLCEKSNTKLCYYMVWPSQTYYHTYDGVIKNHRDAAQLNDAILLPVGEVWKAYFDRTDNFQYYGPDGFHRSLLGSKVAARVIVEYLLKDKK
ncbi:SGNH/GDSL hydrolase family protein [Winogradskyella alexanderae]|uniref:SGNH/GDSL hydrolase family protein n=1 Tax=Winogradskyella alexanderae TaxID=2877123 RepID=A0ABS7XQ38_9FLAO|nr:SGNH/GDSL hydrolase family protein [Winogradskyella alexanderae]MCA0132132.1 SGNH/GDSL hydrolase family protein [Winogradskyella alexanderae]